MDEVTREAINDILRSALERTQRAVDLVPPDSPAARELGIAQYLIDSVMQTISNTDAENTGGGSEAGAPDGDAIHDQHHLEHHLPISPLTLREAEVLSLMATGLRNKEIAARLGISERTATFHVGNVLSKLGADGRVEAISIARRHHLLT